jgi:LuxR family maltose regulon positive regulatory protein
MMASRNAVDQQLPEDDLTLLQYLHEGLSNKEIASRLQVAEVTVKAKFGKLYKRFGVNMRLQLLAAAMKQGLVKASGP